MAAACQIVPAPDRVASDLIAFIDCEARTLAVEGYASLAAPGSSVSLAITALLTIFIALFGYRLLFGDTPDAKSLVLAILKIGIVLAFSTSWAAYQPVVYDTIWQAPAQLAAEIGGSTEVGGGLSARLDNVDRSFRILSIYGVGGPLGVTGQAPGPAPFIGFDSFALGMSRIILLVAAVGGFGIVRLAAGLLLALGPFFIAFLLFDATRGLFIGWVKALIGAALASLALILMLRIGVLLLDPWLYDLVARRTAGQSIAGSSGPLFAATLIVALLVAGVLFIAARVTSPLGLASATVVRVREAVSGARVETMAASASGAIRDRPAEAARSRAAAIADSIATTQRREEAWAGGISTFSSGSGGTPRLSEGAAERQMGPSSGSARRTQRRTSANLSARDTRS